MAYPITQDVYELFQSGAYQQARITMGQTIIDNSRIVQGGLSINRYCSTGNKAMVGACVASELSLTLENHDGFYNLTNFMGRELFVEIGVADENEVVQYIPMGYFGIDQSPRKQSRITISALDRMLWFEIEPDPEALTFPCTITDLLADICSECGVTRKITGALTNGTYVVDEYPQIARTYRDILSWICEVTGTNAYFDYDGELVLDWYTTTPSATLTVANRILSDTSEESIVITGVEIQTETETYISGLKDYALTISQNPLLKEGVQAVADALNLVVNRFTYKAFSATVLSMPHLYPMDGATFIDKDGNSFFVAITDWTFKLNGNTELRGRGESSKQASYVNPYGKTGQGIAVDEAIELLRANIIRTAEVLNEQMDSVQQTLHGEVTALSSQFGTYREETDLRIEANAQSITQNYTDVQSLISETNANLSATSNTVNEQGDVVSETLDWKQITESYIKTGLLYYENNIPVNGIAIGQLTYEEVNGKRVIKREGFYATYTGSDIVFYRGTTEVARYADFEAFVNRLVTNEIVMGKFTLKADTNGWTIK